MKRGKFITFEGCDGCGKSTQLKKLSDYLTENKIEYIFTREPGGGNISEAIREILLNGKNTEMSDECEALLYAASRAQHIHDRIEPALKEGKVVVCDRYVDSSFAYQAYARGLGMEFVSKINHFALDKFLPDLTFFIDLSPEEAFARKHGADENDRMEQAGLAFHKKVYEGYLDLAEKYNCTEKTASTMLYNGGFKIYSTVNPEIQETMEKIISRHQRRYRVDIRMLAGYARTLVFTRRYLTKAQATDVVREFMNTVGCCEIKVTSVCVVDGCAQRKTKIFIPDEKLQRQWQDKFLLSNDDEKEYVKKMAQRVQRAQSLQNLSPVKEMYVRGQIDSNTKQRLLETLLEADHMVPVVADKGWCYYLDWVTYNKVDLKRVRKPSRDEVKASGMTTAEYVLNNVRRGTMFNPRSEW